MKTLKLFNAVLADDNTNHKKLIYYDHHHFTYDGSKRMVNKILETYYNIN